MYEEVCVASAIAALPPCCAESLWLSGSRSPISCEATPRARRSLANLREGHKTERRSLSAQRGGRAAKRKNL
jgi:hypothetical protein